jgi:hypothetical protein
MTRGKFAPQIHHGSDPEGKKKTPDPGSGTLVRTLLNESGDVAQLFLRLFLHIYCMTKKLNLIFKEQVIY